MKKGSILMRDHPSNRIDMRSDTITQPSAAMREVMAAALVGDDVLGDDPTVNELQDRIASILGKEAALFVPSGTMANAVAIQTHTRPGDEIIMHETAHIYRYEGGGYAALAGCSVALIGGERGMMLPKDVKNAIRKSDGSQSHYPNCTLICVENTSNMGGGSVYPQSVLDEICAVGHKNGCEVHLDGARMFNAAAASGTTAARMVRDFDSISICLSKGLGAPVGSLLIGSSEFIARAHRWRKLFGGGMRQAGIIAAAGIYALENNIERLVEDHDRAKRLATSVNAMSAYSVDMESVQSNMVFISTKEKDATRIVAHLSECGIDVFDINDSVIRAVIHLHITDEDIDKSISAFESAMN